jgi:hypothetical protein
MEHIPVLELIYSENGIHCFRLNSLLVAWILQDQTSLVVGINAPPSTNGLLDSMSTGIWLNERELTALRAHNESGDFRKAQANAIMTGYYQTLYLSDDHQATEMTVMSSFQRGRRIRLRKYDRMVTLPYRVFRRLYVIMESLLLF